MSYSREFKTALYSLDGVGVKKYHQTLKILKKHEVEESDFWVNRHNIWQKLPFNQKIEKSIYFFKKENDSYSYFEKNREKNVRVVFEEDKEYPFLLKELELGPPLLFVKGNKLKVNKPLAMIGTRKITSYGHSVIRYLLSSISKEISIISGFMYGTDVNAQAQALGYGMKTVGILGFGFDHIYPAHHKKIMNSFLEKGATFISPFAPHVYPRPGSFIVRDKIVAAMSQATCVIEVAPKSGSLFTAKTSINLGKKTWVIPVSIFSSFAKGLKELADCGASLLSDVDDINSFFQIKKTSSVGKYLPDGV